MIHTRQIEQFGGTDGLRDEGLLDSALAQPQATFGGDFLHPTVAAQAGAYLYHLVMNHPFIDGNKRTAFAVMDVFLRVNGYQLILSDDEAYNVVIRVVKRELTKSNLVDELGKVIRAKLP